MVCVCERERERESESESESEFLSHRDSVMVLHCHQVLMCWAAVQYVNASGRGSANISPASL